MGNVFECNNTLIGLPSLYWLKRRHAMRMLDSTSAKWPKKIRTDKVSNSSEGKRSFFPRD